MECRNCPISIILGSVDYFLLYRKYKTLGAGDCGWCALACYGYCSLEESEGCMCYVVVYVCVCEEYGGVCEGGGMSVEDSTWSMTGDSLPGHTLLVCCILVEVGSQRGIMSFLWVVYVSVGFLHAGGAALNIPV